MPDEGEKITFVNGDIQVPKNPIIPFIEGDGIGLDIWRATRQVVDAAVENAYGGERSIAWCEVFAGEKAKSKFDEWLPQETVDAISDLLVAIKGPLTTPVGDGNSQSECDAAPGFGPVQLCAALSLYRGGSLTGQRAAQAQRGHLSGEHRGRLCRYRMGAGK